MKRKILLCAISAVLLALAAAVISGVFAETKWPKTGNNEKTNGKLKLDVSNVSDGYFMASSAKKSKHKLKLRVTKDGETLTYDLNMDGDYEVFPLQLGDGNYEISLWENVSGKQYSNAGKIAVNVSLKDAYGCFLYPNQYVSYTKKSEAVTTANKLCKDKSPKEAYAAIKNYMVTSFVYDFVKAAAIKPGELPDIDGSFTKRMGVCQDLSAIMVCMLRSQGIHAKLVIGYADKNYHAWVTTMIDGKEVSFDPTAALDAISKPKSYSVERYY